MEASQLAEKANDIRKDILTMITEAGSGHPGGSLSCTDMLTALYFGGVLDHDPADPAKVGRDRFILAKGHAAPALYATLAHAGYFPIEELATLRKLGTRLQGHPDSNLLPGVEVSTGSLGQGLSVAAGLAAHQRLGRLIAIIDNNELQIDGCIHDVCDPGDLGEKFAAFGWDVVRVDGHDIDALVATLGRLKAAAADEAAPVAVIAATVKGKGVSFMENQAGWHGKAPKAEELEIALAELSAAVA